MQPSVRHCLWASLVLLILFAAAPSAFADTLMITSTPAGATVELDGVIVGTTPYRANFPGGYFHKTHTVFGSRLDHAIELRVYLAGYAPQQFPLTDGPLDWMSVTGRREGTYYLLKTNRIDVKLMASQVGRGAMDPSHEGPLPLRPANDVIGGTAAAPGDAAGTGSVAIESSPSGAEIYVDGNFVGQTPATLRLAAGAHRIEVRAAGRPSWTKNIDVLKDSQVSLRATFDEGADGTIKSADAKSGTEATR